MGTSEVQRRINDGVKWRRDWSERRDGGAAVVETKVRKRDDGEKNCDEDGGGDILETLIRKAWREGEKKEL